MKPINTQIPFYQSIKKICKLQNISLIELEKSCLINENKWMNDLLWISKFAFDREWNFYLKSNSKARSTSNNNLKKLDNFSNHSDMTAFLEKYPCLSELLFVSIKAKKLLLEEIISCFEQDKDELIELFNFDKTIQIIKVDVGEGDVHQYGKSTAIVYLNNNSKLIYKPRSGGLDEAFNTLLEEINLAEIGIDFKIVHLLNKTNYSWVEYIKHTAVKNKQELNNYYKRCGGIIGISYFLMGFDLHFENIIAHGQYPMLIDVECMFNSNDNDYNILSSGLIPRLYSIENNIFDCSGLGADGLGQTIPYWQWKNLNSDELDLVKCSGSIKKEKNQPMIQKYSVSPKEYLNEIVEGFASISNWFLQHRDKENFNHVFSNFRNKTIRILPRSTQSYINILENSYQPKALVSLKERSEMLNKYLNIFPFLSTITDEDKISIKESEKKALLRTDIPYFTGNTSDTYLRESDKKVIDNYFENTPLSFIVNRINTLTENNIQEQIELIKDAFDSRYHLQKALI